MRLVVRLLARRRLAGPMWLPMNEVLKIVRLVFSETLIRDLAGLALLEHISE